MHIQLDFTLHWWAWPLLYLGALVYLWVATWTHFLAIFHLKKVEAAQGLRPVSRVVGYWLVLPSGLLHDFLLNLAVSLPLLDPPRETLLTGRLQRYVDGPDGWRRRFALALDADKLEPYDSGHIKKKEASRG